MEKQYMIQKGHKILQEDHCSGFLDSFGQWNNGFPCPPVDRHEMHCCGHDNHKYCCIAPAKHVPVPYSQLAVVLGGLGCVVVVSVATLLFFCLKCRLCPLYKKSQPASGGPVYEMHCSSTSSGVVNMCNGSRVSTPPATSQTRETDSVTTSSTSQFDFPFLYSSSLPETTSLSGSSGSTLIDTAVRTAPMHTFNYTTQRLPPPYSLHEPSTLAVRSPPSFTSTTFLQNHSRSLARTAPPLNASQGIGYRPGVLTHPRAIAALSQVGLQATSPPDPSTQRQSSPFSYQPRSFASNFLGRGFLSQNGTIGPLTDSNVQTNQQATKF